MPARSARKTRACSPRRAAKNGRYLLLIMMDIDPEHEEEFHRWYNEEHLPERAFFPGFLTARRFQAIEGKPKFMAFYDLESPDVLKDPEYLKMREASAWSKAIEPRFRNFVRNVYVDITPDVSRFAGGKLDRRRIRTKSKRSPKRARRGR